MMKICADMLDAWWSLADELMLKHAQPAAPGVGVGVNYPSWWLDAVGYPDGPPPVDSPKHAEAQKTSRLQMKAVWLVAFAAAPRK